MGTFDALKAYYNRMKGLRIKAEGFSPKILSETEAQRNAAFFEVLNALEENNVPVLGDMTVLDSKLSGNVAEAIQKGREMLKPAFEKTSKDFEQAERLPMQMRDQEGAVREVEMILGSSDNPLAFTNHAYSRVKKDAIVAVYAGTDRKSGDMYDIGIQPEKVTVINLRGLVIALNRAEQQKRKEIYSKSPEEQSPEEQALIKNWESQADRAAFDGVKEFLSDAGDAEDAIPFKDPTVLVANGSLIAASRTSLLTQEEFQTVIHAFVSSQKT